ncbi:hypothetical protein ACFQXA_04765 [Nocardiopsis composta]
MWGGGLAMLDPALPGAAPARAYLVGAEQFADIAAQEMYRSPGTARIRAPRCGPAGRSSGPAGTRRCCTAATSRAARC